MHTSTQIALIPLFFIALAGCDQIADKAASKFLKEELKDKCNEQDTACIAAVDQQFDPCHMKYEEEWLAYLEASLDDEVEKLQAYSKSMYGCIVDKNGEPYFSYHPK